jgi:hypothetical protein
VESMKCQMELWLSSRYLIFGGFVNVWLQPRLEMRVLRVRGRRGHLPCSVLHSCARGV